MTTLAERLARLQREFSAEQLEELLLPDVIAAEIVDDLEAALAQFTKIAARLAPRLPAGD